uniref:Ig-like domain-containing protein n=1 Tax=Pygocentrus nattereri TaxID=42514 RepID=A0AAR2JHS1_PYGNA
YIITATTPGIDFPEYIVVGLVDEEQFVYYDSNIKKMIPKTEWMQKNVRVHTLLRRSGYNLDKNGSVTGYFQFNYDGEEFLILDLKTLTWTAAHQKALGTKLKWEAAGDPHFRKHYLDNDCVDYLRKYLVELTTSKKNKLVCHATGFFPKAVMISWQKDGEDLHKDVELRETLPNQDGTFQKRSVLTVSPEELNRHNYTCIIQHSSLEEEVVLLVSDLVISICAHVAVLLLVLIVFAGVLIWIKT